LLSITLATTKVSLHLARYTFEKDPSPSKVSLKINNSHGGISQSLNCLSFKL
jgi:hypothetical protein